jgi:hypothetical protein
VFDACKRLVRFSELLQWALRSERVHAQVAILLFGVWCGYLAQKCGWWSSFGAFSLFEHVVSWGGLLAMGWLVRREDRARAAECA